MLNEETVSIRMINYRAKNNLTQEKFAKVLGMSVYTINSIEQVKGKAKKTTLAKINFKIDELEEKGE